MFGGVGLRRAAGSTLGITGSGALASKSAPPPDTWSRSWSPRPRCATGACSTSSSSAESGASTRSCWRPSTLIPACVDAPKCYARSPRRAGHRRHPPGRHAQVRHPRLPRPCSAAPLRPRQRLPTKAAAMCPRRTALRAVHCRPHCDPSQPAPGRLLLAPARARQAAQAGLYRRHAQGRRPRRCTPTREPPLAALCMGARIKSPHFQTFLGITLDFQHECS